MKHLLTDVAFNGLVAILTFYAAQQANASGKIAEHISTKAPEYSSTVAFDPIRYNTEQFEDLRYEFQRRFPGVHIEPERRRNCIDGFLLSSNSSFDKGAASAYIKGQVGKYRPCRSSSTV